jgi:hypothetical protein
MKKLVSLIALTVILSVAFTGVVFAAGGIPGAHGLDGQTFGGAVSGLAQTDPAALVAHILEDWVGLDVDEMGMPEGLGMPAAHGVDGKTFGGLVSALAQMDPAALVAHIRGCAPAADYMRR